MRPAVNGERFAVAENDICINASVVGRFRQRNITIDVEPAVA